MRSSTLSSSKSFTSKYKLKQKVICPITQKFSKATHKASSQNKTKSKRQNCLEDWIICEGLIKPMPFITLKNGKFTVNEQALSFLERTSKTLLVEFVGCFGSNKLITNFFEGISFLSNRKIQNLDCQQKQEGLFIYNISLKNKKKMIYFLELRCQSLCNSENGQKIMHMLMILSSYFVFFITEKQQQQSLLEKVIELLKKIQEIQKNQLQCFQIPNICHLVFNNRIKASEDTINHYEDIFSSLILSCMKSTSTSKGTFSDEKCSESIFRIVKYFVENQQSKTDKNYLFNAQNIKFILQNSIKQIMKEQSDAYITKNDEIIPIPWLTKTIYDHKLFSIKCSYEQYFNMLHFETIESKDDLLASFADKQETTITQFNSEVLDKSYSHFYQEQILTIIREFEQRILKNYQFYLYDNCQEDMEETQEQEQNEVNGQTSLLNAIQEMQNKYNRKSSINEGNNRNSPSIDKILILARNAARLNILGYDEKMKIAELRQSIDQKWTQLRGIHQQKMRKSEEPTESNLLREKHKIMEEKMNSLADKCTFLKKEINLITNIQQYQARTLLSKEREYTQISQLKQKQQALIKYIANSSIQNPLISSLQNQIREFALKANNLSLKKQLILQSLQDSAKDVVDKF